MDRRFGTDRRLEIFRSKTGVVRMDNNPRNARFFVSALAIVTGKQIGRASCRERV